LRQRERGCLGDRVGRSERHARQAANDNTLTTAPRERATIGRKACDTPYVPKRLTARCRSRLARLLRSL
jgi:hypothetical protein